MADILTLGGQRETKPKIEEVMPHFLGGEELESALNFVAHLRANKTNLIWAGVHNFWNAKSKGKNVCYTKLGGSWIGRKLPGTEVDVRWEVELNLMNMSAYEDKIIAENMQEYIWNGFAHCRSCGNGCPPGVDKTILGRDFTGLCNGMFYTRFIISFVNPDEAALDVIKKLIEWEKQARSAAK